MQLMNQLKYPLMNLLVVDAADESAEIPLINLLVFDAADESAEIPFDEPFGS